MCLVRQRFAVLLFPVAVFCATAVWSLAEAPTPLAPGVFSEGVIVTKVSLPGNTLDKLLSQLDPAKGDIQAQMQQLAAGMSVTEQQQLQAQAATMPPAMSIGAVMLPRKGTIYCRGQEARATTDGLTYHLENYFNHAKSNGLLLLQSKAQPQGVAYTYDAAKVDKVWQTISVTAADYTMKPNTETALVAGYPSTKTTYTLKPGAATTEAGPMGMSEKPVALDVWTSAQIPQMLNFAHPVYVAEKHGITKLVVYFDKERKYKLLYEFVSIQPKPVTPQDLKITPPEPILDYEKDQAQIGMKSLAIMLGGGMQAKKPSANAEQDE